MTRQHCFDAAAKRNLLIYDIDASPGVLTERLVKLMRTCFGRNLVNTMQFLFVSPNAMESLTGPDNDDVIINGVHVFKLDEMENRNMQDYLRKIGCSPAVVGGNHLETDQEFVVGSNKNILNIGSVLGDFNPSNETMCECMLGSI